jgi:signal transduction histidine kinase
VRSPSEGESNGARVWLSLAEDLPPAEGFRLEVRLLIRLLVSDALATLPGGSGLVTVRTAPGPDHVLLRVEDTGRPLHPEAVGRLFDSSVVGRPGSHRLELAACESLVRRRLQGTIQAENRPEGGAAISVRLRPWK